MSDYQVLLVRASLVWLVTTAMLGVAMNTTPGVAGLFRTTHVHLGVLGFFLSMVMGVAYWTMPRPGSSARRCVTGRSYTGNHEPRGARR